MARIKRAGMDLRVWALALHRAVLSPPALTEKGHPHPKFSSLLHNSRRWSGEAHYFPRSHNRPDNTRWDWNRENTLLYHWTCESAFLLPRDTRMEGGACRREPAAPDTHEGNGKPAGLGLSSPAAYWHQQESKATPSLQRRKPFCRPKAVP